MNETRFKVASVHQVLPLSGGGQQCLCGVVLLKHRDATEHITDMVLVDLLARVLMLRDRWRAEQNRAAFDMDAAATIGARLTAIDAVLALLGGDSE